MDQFNIDLIADPPLKNPYFALPDIANILTPRDEVARLRIAKKTPNTLIGLFGQADRMTEQESTEFILQILQHGGQHLDGFKPDWKAIANALGVANGHHVKRRFEIIIKAHGFHITREGVISGRGNIVASAEAEADADAIANARATAMARYPAASTSASTSAVTAARNPRATSEVIREAGGTGSSSAAALEVDDMTDEDYNLPPFFPDTDLNLDLDLDIDNTNIDPSLLMLRNATSTLPDAYGTNLNTPSTPFSASISTPIVPSTSTPPRKSAPFSATSGFRGLARGQGTTTQNLPLSNATASAISKRGLSPVSGKKGRGAKNKRDAAHLADLDTGNHEKDDGGGADVAASLAPPKKKRGRPSKASQCLKNDGVGVLNMGGDGAADLVGVGSGLGIEKGAMPGDGIDFDG